VWRAAVWGWGQMKKEGMRGGRGRTPESDEWLVEIRKSPRAMKLSMKKN